MESNQPPQCGPWDHILPIRNGKQQNFGEGSRFAWILRNLCEGKWTTDEPVMILAPTTLETAKGQLVYNETWIDHGDRGGNFDPRLGSFYGTFDRETLSPQTPENLLFEVVWEGPVSECAPAQTGVAEFLFASREGRATAWLKAHEGFDVNAAYDGKSMFELMADYQFGDIVTDGLDDMVASGASFTRPFTRDNRYRCFLHWAASGHPEIIDWAIDRGIDLSWVDPEGNSVRDHVARSCANGFQRACLTLARLDGPDASPEADRPFQDRGMETEAYVPGHERATQGARVVDPPERSFLWSRPATHISGSIGDMDYPASCMRNEQEGLMRVEARISSEGRVTMCSIASSSGHPDLDDATCDLIRRRFRFDPARNWLGRPTAGTVVLEIEWRLPD